MKQGFITSVMADYSFEQVVDFASDNGFECIEVACWPKGKAERKYAGVTHIDVASLDSVKADEILQYCKKKNITISALAYYPNVLDEDRECQKKSIDHLMKVIQASALLKINLVTTFIGRNKNLNITDNLELAENVWKPILEYAESLNVKIAIENCPMLFTEDEWPGGKNIAVSPAIWRELFKRLPSEYLGLNFDPSHFIWQEMDYIRPLYEFKDKIFIRISEWIRRQETKSEFWPRRFLIWFPVYQDMAMLTGRDISVHYWKSDIRELPALRSRINPLKIIMKILRIH